VTNQPPRPTLSHLAQGLAAGEITSRALVQRCLENIRSPDGEGARTFLKVHAQTALASAESYDQMRRRGATLPRYAGIPLSVKDLFDLAGDVTTAGSRVLADAPPAVRDAEAITRLKAAGFIVMGRTNMTEFAYSGLGINPHYDTPRNAWDRSSARIPGGSSSGAAVSITDEMAYAAIGTDTGGSCRIPAAMCGIVGFKPTAARVPMSGAYPLSQSLDSIGPLANSVACCRILDAVLAGEPDPDLQRAPIRGLRLGVLASYATEDLSAEVSSRYSQALQKIQGAGAQLKDFSLPELIELPDINRKGGFTAVESFAMHHELIAKRGAEYDPRVLSRMLRGREQSSDDERELHRRRVDLIERVQRRVTGFDALLMPTVPVPAPPMAQLVTDSDYSLMNALVLRNPSVVNFLDGCALSLPCHEPGGTPVGLTVFGLHNSDHKVLSVAAALEACLL
jgi:aspartyl-tRNA(Asn)/glutamyl-tRNA(Gln) amidotransferase subunit A